MTVRELKDLLKDAPDEAKVLMPVNTQEFDGYWMSPCPCDTGMAQLGVVEGVDGVHSNDFVLVPHGFFDTGIKEGEEVEEEN